MLEKAGLWPGGGLNGSEPASAGQVVAEADVVAEPEVTEADLACQDKTSPKGTRPDSVVFTQAGTEQVSSQLQIAVGNNPKSL